MKHYGDITKINGATVEPVDCIIGGSPCQDLSVAGKRAGLQGERSGLFMEQTRVIKEMREHDRAIGRTDVHIRPRYMVWENVPGAFSSAKGKDFAAVLEETIKVVEPKIPDVPVPDKGWPTAGSIRDVDGRWSVAWRTLDAQYWGVPQRRRRIALVADFGGDTASEILFERNSLQGHPQTSRETRESSAGDTENSTAYTVKIRGGCDGGGKGALVQTDKSATLATHQDQVLFQPQAYSFDSLASNSMKSANPHSGCRMVDCSKTLDTSIPDPSKNQGGIAIVQPTFCIQGNCIDRADTAGCNGKGWTEDVSYTLNTIDRHAVYDARGNGDGKIACTITGDHQDRVTDYTAIVCSQDAYDKYTEADTVSTLKAQGGSYGGGSEALVIDRKNGGVL